MGAPGALGGATTDEGRGLAPGKLGGRGGASVALPDCRPGRNGGALTMSPAAMKEPPQSGYYLRRPGEEILTIVFGVVNELPDSKSTYSLTARFFFVNEFYSPCRVLSGVLVVGPC